MLASSCRLRTIEPSGMILLTAKGYSIYELDICTVTFSVGFHFSVRFFSPVSGGRGVMLPSQYFADVSIIQSR